MAYTINLTNGTIFATIPDGTINTSSSMTLIGKNYAGYGQFLDDNFIHLMENFSNSTPPPTPLVGQLWWDSTNKILKAYNSAGWKSLGFLASTSTAPTNNTAGDLWYDTTNQQLNLYTISNAWITVGPAYSSTQGKSGSFGLTATDINSTVYYVTGIYDSDQLVAVFNNSSDFVPATPSALVDNFSVVYNGLTTWNQGRLAGNIVNSGNVYISAGNTSVASATVIVTSTGSNIEGYAYATGNITTESYFIGNGSQLSGVTSSLSNAVISTTGNVTGGNVIATNGFYGQSISVSGNVTGGNLNTGGLVYASQTITSGANITGANLLTSGLVSASSFIGSVVSVSSNINGGNLSVAGSITANTSITGANITGSNFFTAGQVSATGNVSGNYILGNGALLTGVITSVANINNGTTDVTIASPGANVNTSVNGTPNVVIVSSDGQYVNGVISTSGNITAAGNVSGSYFFGNGSQLTGVITSTSGGGISTTGNVTAGNIIATVTMYSPSIQHTGSNGVGNIGSSTSYFNRLFATATTALYADVAERFAADEALMAGTVVELGGEKEITKSRQELSDKVFGVISTRAAYLMNGGAGTDETHPPVAMTGRVPVQCVGKVAKGDRLVSAGNGMARAALPGEATAFNTIGRALANKTTEEIGLVEAIVTIK